MAKTAIGSRCMESAVRSMPTSESVIMLARAYDQLVKDLEYALLHISEENLSAELRSRFEKRDA
ncbi:MAG: hypothetical protein IIU63_06430 [Clostridia bacterium]|nr:hypothetical protein [Clostridia bacterium]